MKGNICLWLALVLLLCSCGKNIPTLSQEELDQKHAALMITPAHFPDSAKAVVQKQLMSWRQTAGVSYEWVPDVEEIQDDLIQKIKNTSYDYIIVIGNGLDDQILPVAEQLNDKKWLLLNDDFSDRTPNVQGQHIAYRRTSSILFQSQWDDWVQQQQAQGKDIEWITTASKPIPSIWAPSEEADHIVYIDGGNPWFNQLVFQVREHRPQWLVTYTNLDETGMKRLKSLNIPVMNMAASKLQLNWDLILGQTLDTIVKNNWRSGLLLYSNEEVAAVPK